MALFSKGERLQLSAWAEKSGESMCLAVKGNADVKTGTDLTIWACDDPKGKMWDFVGSTRNGGTFQMKYKGETKEKFSLCVAGQKSGGSRDFESGSQFCTSAKITTTRSSSRWRPPRPLEIRRGSLPRCQEPIQR